MPRRLLLAAEIISDVAESSNDPEFRRLLTLADGLREIAGELGDRAGIDIKLCSRMESLQPVIRRLAAAFDPEVDIPLDKVG